jgi:hypothetical protein
MTITAIRRGETITVTNPVVDRRETFMVLSPCQHRAPGYLCASCDVNLANVYNVELHAESAPDVNHRVVAWCGVCRCYREPDAAQLATINIPQLSTQEQP